MDPLHSSAVGLVAMPGISAQSPWTGSMTWPGGLGYSRGSKKCIAGGDTECCCMGRLTRLNQLKLANFSPNIDEFSRVRVPKSGHRVQSGHYPAWGALRGRRGSIRLQNRPILATKWRV
eukprot:scaffold4499_cov31-Phaeocystis_antarctica.AAC.1